jgi:hypothetical protein
VKIRREYLEITLEPKPGYKHLGPTFVFRIYFDVALALLLFLGAIAWVVLTRGTR